MGYHNHFKLKLYLLILFLFPLTVFASQNVDQVNSLIFSGNYEEAIYLLDRQTDFSPGDKEFLKGVCYQNLAGHQNAITSFLKALKSNPQDTRILLSLSASYMALGNYLKAERTLLNLLKIKPDLKAGQIKLARVYLKQKKFKNAAGLYKKLLRTDKDNAVFKKSLGLCYFKQDSLDLSLKLFHNSLALNSADQEVYGYLNTIFRKQEKFNEAENICELGLEHFPDSKLLMRYRADNLFQLQKYDQAVVIYQKLINSGDSSLAVFKKLGISA